MKVGDLVKWRHPNETDIGVVSAVGDVKIVVKVMWSDGDHKWYSLIDLEIVNESR